MLLFTSLLCSSDVVAAVSIVTAGIGDVSGSRVSEERVVEVKGLCLD